MPRNISPSEAAKRLSSAGFNFAERYAQGVENKGSEWQRGASAAKDNYTQGVQKAIASNEFAKGVQRAGSARYDDGVRTKGILNWPTGMQLAEGRYLDGIGPFTGLWDQSLPTPRGAKGSPANLKRMQENVQRFVNAKK